ncbi:helicase associated domain-containing protein [Streptomyces sp. HNM0663]|uniref:Helicase associated domain-containing protein n=1 Tax=Streptomyces chengmaiensis TaxID=3040919 RepID=A0ABT6HYQ0_9ACTN|nr:helicase associated domain-containing protein [Streptomyces chengmaiensis]MDH2393848.1 helicase associated domain-containing protein [Streptomyces chengmaiensis]
MHDFLPPQPQPPRTAAARPGPVRLAPLQGETNLSYLDRLADRYRLGVRDLIPALLQTGGGLFKGYRTDGEVYLNAEARARISTFSRVPEEILQRALPAWTAQEPVSPEGAGAAGRFRFGSVVPSAGEGCRLCTAARTGRTKPARLYLKPHTRICPRHRRWMLGTHWIDGAPADTEQVDLTGLPEMVTAHWRHLDLLRHRPEAARAFEVAHAVAVSWWAQQWPEEEQWPRRALRLAPPGTDPGWWRLLARDAVTYPETVALTSLLTDDRTRQQLLADTGGHLPHTLAHVPGLVGELARVTGRPWLAERVASTSAGPLLLWVQHCVRDNADEGGADRLWTLHMAHRPRPIARELQAYRDAAHKLEEAEGRARLHLGLRHRSDQAFTTGLAHARAYAAVHGHLAAPIHSRFNGFALGRWLSNHRKFPAMPPEHVAALEALDPWWRPPWTVMWQRFYYQARDHTRAHGPLRPEHGFATTSFGLGEWLYNQCTGYDDLHPAQQRLLADIGLTPEAVQAARPRRKHMATHFQRALACARAFADTHGTLVTATTDTVQDGLKLGQWLANQRSKDRAYQNRHGTPSPRALALSAIDPWWNPPWTLEWQRSWHQARTHVQDGHVLDAAAGFAGTSSALATWLTTQCAQYDTLQPDQQDLLAHIGLTADRARGAAARPAEREADFAVGLGYAHSYHATHRTLAAAIDTVHDGFQLGRWLRRQRQHARTDAHRGALLSAAAKALARIDPWWCPPWTLAWQRTWQHIHDQVEAGHRLDADHHFRSFAPAQRTWLRQQCNHYDDLHPGQQRLLAGIGLTREAAHTRPLTPYAETALAHARAYAAAHHTLAVAYSTVHDGFPLGRWLNDQRQQARRETTPNARHQALTAIDPWWNPPWDLAWQRAYTRARTTQSRPHGVPADVRSWIRAQHTAWTHLRPQQQQLLTDLGITPTGRRRTIRVYPTSPGLAHARTYATLNGHLACSKDTRHDDFALGDWLTQKRRAARQGRLSPTTAHALDNLDPWWCPPWPHTWQRAYQQAKLHHYAGQDHSPTLQRWAEQQRTRWNALHPTQQELLSAIDIHPG